MSGRENVGGGVGQWLEATYLIKVPEHLPHRGPRTHPGTARHRQESATSAKAQSVVPSYLPR